MVGEEYRSHMGFKEMIIKEQIMAVCGRPVSDLPDCRLMRDLGVRESQMRRILLNISKTLCQDPVENPIFADKVQTVGDVLFYFYAPAERYKYFERIILNGVHAAGDFMRVHLASDELLKDSVLRDQSETESVFRQIQIETGRDYRKAFHQKVESDSIKTVQDFIQFLSCVQNGEISFKKGKSGLGKFLQVFEREQKTR